MVGVRTVALIERRPDISRNLFTRYWRDVHGVLAARIPGFERYVQYHVTPAEGHGEGQNFEGIALVTFTKESDRDGLANSSVTRHIHRDEQNVFRRALLYNLEAEGFKAGAGKVEESGSVEAFYLVPAGRDAAKVQSTLRMARCRRCDCYDLRSGDPSAWNNTDADDGGSGLRFTHLLHVAWANVETSQKAKEMVDATIGVYDVDEMHVMVEHGYPTPVGLRGLDAVRTIEEANAVNQLASPVVADVYGSHLARPDG